MQIYDRIWGTEQDPEQDPESPSRRRTSVNNVSSQLGEAIYEKRGRLSKLFSEAMLTYCQTTALLHDQYVNTNGTRTHAQQR